MSFGTDTRRRFKGILQALDTLASARGTVRYLFAPRATDTVLIVVKLFVSPMLHHNLVTPC